MEIRPLTYESQMEVFQFLPLENRRRIAKRYPESRRYHRKLPISLKTVCFEYDEDPDRWYKYHEITLDGLIWKIRRKTNCNDSKTVTLPSGKRVDVKSVKKISEELVPRFIKYYLGRKGTRIQEFRVRDYKFPIFDIPSMNIQELWLACLMYDLDENLLNYLKNSHFKQINTNYINGLEDLWEYLRQHKITADFLMVKDEYILGPMLDIHGIAKTTHVLDRRAPRENVEGHLRSLVEDTEEKYSIGMVYRGFIRMHGLGGLNMEQVEWLERLRNMFNAKYKYHGNTSGLCLEMPGDRELFLTARKNALNRLEEEGQDNMIFRVDVLKKATTFLYHELPAALQERYQALNAEHTRLQVIADRENHRRAQAEREQRRAQRELERADRRNSTSFKVRHWLRTNLAEYVNLIFLILFVITLLAVLVFGSFVAIPIFFYVTQLFMLLMLICCHRFSDDEDGDEDEEEEQDEEEDDEEEEEEESEDDN